MPLEGIEMATASLNLSLKSLGILSKRCIFAFRLHLETKEPQDGLRFPQEGQEWPMMDLSCHPYGLSWPKTVL